MNKTSAEHKKRLARERTRRWRESNRQKCIDSDRAYRKKHPIRHLIAQAKQRSKGKLDFDIEEKDFLPLPVECPVLAFKLIYGARTGGRPHPCSASLDRFDNSKGYVKGNVNIISWRANELKKDASSKELLDVVEYIENGIQKDFAPSL